MELQRVRVSAMSRTNAQDNHTTAASKNLLLALLFSLIELSDNNETRCSSSLTNSNTYVTIER
jgi:hypothetical protein